MESESGQGYWLVIYSEDLQIHWSRDYSALHEDPTCSGFRGLTGYSGSNSSSKISLNPDYNKELLNPDIILSLNRTHPKINFNQSQSYLQQTVYTLNRPVSTSTH